jgi:type II restriction/modification system DNA methylase subunit YeeA
MTKQEQELEKLNRAMDQAIADGDVYKQESLAREMIEVNQYAG